MGTAIWDGADCGALKGRARALYRLSPSPSTRLGGGPRKWLHYAPAGPARRSAGKGMNGMPAGASNEAIGFTHEPGIESMPIHPA